MTKLDELIRRYEHHKDRISNLYEHPGIQAALSHLSGKDASLAILEDVIERLKELKQNGSISGNAEELDTVSELAAGEAGNFL